MCQQIIFTVWVGVVVCIGVTWSCYCCCPQTPVIGVVSWLGTFITDLVMIDNAHSAFTPEGYINFEKCCTICYTNLTSRVFPKHVMLSLLCSLNILLIMCTPDLNMCAGCSRSLFCIEVCFCISCFITMFFFVDSFRGVGQDHTLYQKAATTYHLQNDPAVKHSLINLQAYSDKERYARSVCSNLYKLTCITVVLYI